MLSAVVISEQKEDLTIRGFNNKMLETYRTYLYHAPIVMLCEAFLQKIRWG
jgi:hypothetical protein